MTYTTRRIIFYTFAVLFLIAAPALILFTEGFRFNLQTGRLERLGVLVIKSKPEEATITLSNKISEEKTPASIKLPADDYPITVSKEGYTTDQTISPTPENPNPAKSPASVAAQEVTTISFSIDLVSSLNISSINSVCGAVGNAEFNILGTKLIGTEPDVFKINQNIITNGSGNYTYGNLEWDNYGLRPLAYDLVGSIPTFPINLLPGVDQPVQLILGTGTANSILVQVKDSITGQPLSVATVRLSAAPYDQTKVTGVGFVQQTDWSGGTGQLNFSDETKYWSDDGKIEANNPGGDLK